MFSVIHISALLVERLRRKPNYQIQLKVINHFIIFVGRLLGPMLLLAFRSEVRSFTSSAVVGVTEKVWTKKIIWIL